MSEPFIAEIRIWGLNFAPRGWAFCNGQLLPISQNTALFSLIGTTYGGDGRTTTGLPDLQGRVPMHPGRGPGLTDRRLGERVGTETVTLAEAQIGNHTHTLQGTNATGTSIEPAGRFPAIFPGVSPGRGQPPVVPNNYKSAPSSWVGMASEVLQPSGGSQAHTNLQPYLALNFCIALVGLYPSRS
jgi:microcystin-dependent protein